MTAEASPVLILGAGYAGVKLAHELSRRSKGSVPTVIVDRHPVHVLRTELYEIGKLAEKSGEIRRWAIPIEKVLDRSAVTFHQGNVDAIDLERSIVTVGGESLGYRALAIGLGNVPSYYGVPGAAEEMHQVYGLSGAMRLARACRELEVASVQLPPAIRPRVVVVGGGSTGTEVAAEIATANWRRIAAPMARPPQVTLICGSLPFLAGLDPRLIEHARRLLFEAGVTLIESTNVRSVGKDRLTLEDGADIPFDLGVWAAGVQAPPIVAALPVPHGRGGRLAVGPTLEVPGRLGVFAVGDAVEFKDPATGASVPSTAQAAIAEATAAAANLLHRLRGEPLIPFQYRERGMIVSVGRRRAAAQLSRVTVWGSPAALLKTLVEREYRLVSEQAGTRP